MLIHKEIAVAHRLCMHRQFGAILCVCFEFLHISRRHDLIERQNDCIFTNLGRIALGCCNLISSAY